MATVILVRHGRTAMNASHVLAGRAEGVDLDEIGLQQASRTAARLTTVPLAGIVTSPLARCQQTAAIIRDAQLDTSHALSAAPTVEPAILECDYGDWQGHSLPDLAKEDLWKVVQTQPSAVTFPGGESLAMMQARTVAAIRRHDAAFEAEFGPGAVWVAVSHGDPIKSVLADALGMHLDLFQRITVGPASVSIVQYGPARPSVVATNTTSGDLSFLQAAPPAADAPVGGGAGADADKAA